MLQALWLAFVVCGAFVLVHFLACLPLRLHLLVSSLKVSCRCFATWNGASIISPAVAAGRHLLLRQLMLNYMYFTVYPKKYAHGFVVLCFVVVMQSFIMNSHEVFIHIHQGCFAGTGAIVRLPQCQWSKPGGYGKISQCITTTKHSKAKTVCIFLGIYCTSNPVILFFVGYLNTLLSLVCVFHTSCRYMKRFVIIYNEPISVDILIIIQNIQEDHSWRATYL